MINNPKIKDLKVGDKLVSVNNINISNFDEVKTIIANSDSVSVKVKRKDKEIEENIDVIETNNERLIGLAFQEVYDYETDPKIEFSFDMNEGGSSAGLMTTLAIFNSLTKFDYTRGLKIAGTGTINMNGEVVDKGGVNYKLLGAVYGKADIFLVPSGDNYKEAIKLKKENNYKIEIVKIDTLDDAINYLKNLKVDKK
jgi:PDZ domain-containing protein